MGGNGVNFNAPKDTTGVNRVNTQNILRAVGQGALKGGINCIFTHGKDSTGNVNGKVDISGVPIIHTDYQNGVPLGTVNYEPSGREYHLSGEDASWNFEKDYPTPVDGHWATDHRVTEEGKSTDLKGGTVNGEVHYEGTTEVKGEIE